MQIQTQDGYDIPTAHLISISGIQGNRDACNVSFYHFKGDKKQQLTQKLPLSVDDVVARVRQGAASVELSAVHYPSRQLTHRPLVKVCENSSVSGSVCALCGFTRKVHHSNHCQCVWHRPFNGRVSEKNGQLVLSKQRLFISKTDPVHQAVSKGREDGFYIPVSVQSISVASGEFKGQVVVAGQRLTVISHNEEFNFLCQVQQSPRHFVWEILDEMTTATLSAGA